MSMIDAAERPLAGVTVVDLLDAPFSGVTRLYAELGAHVVRVEGDGRADLCTQIANLGKEIVAPDDEGLTALLNRADLIVEGYPRRPGLAPIDDLLAPERRERAVVMTVSAFGVGNALSDWQVTDPVLHALSSGLSRSGLDGRAPLLPPGELALQCALAQAGWAGMAALFAAQRTGVGDRIDLSILEAAVQALDPGFGISGSATLGKAAKHLPPGRPPKGLFYPVFPCADGHVRLCVLAPRQWQNLFRWMGEPAEFAGPEFNNTRVRQESPALLAATAAFLAPKTRAEAEAEGGVHSVPIAALLSRRECLDTPHIRARGAVTYALLAEGEAPIPDGVIEVDGKRMGVAAPRSTASRLQSGEADPTLPLAGLKVLDLGVIVVGGEQSRLLADLGADVVKVESAAFPDGTRHSYLPTGLSVSFAAGHRNKRSLGLDLRHPDGKALFRRLAAEADVILSNFKPGTIESLGFGYDEIAALNPGIVMVESSAFGATGPWAGRMGYGPLVRAAAGLTSEWRYADDDDNFCDSLTIYPDHVGARYGAVAALAMLMRRARTGRGGRASISQLEVALSHFAAEIAADELGVDLGPDTPWSVFQAAGVDEWCVVTVRNDDDWHALASVVGGDLRDPTFATRDARVARRDEIDSVVGGWMAAQNADAAMRELQAAGVPAARMLRVADLPDFDYFRAREFYRTDMHPHMAEPVVAERRYAASRLLAEAPARPAPLVGEHSAEVVRDWLGLDDGEIERLFAGGVLQPVAPEIARMVAAGEGRGEAA